ncbi:hypothetical protein KUTeg_024436 [Tegillarca granosa]|uniref:Ubiquitin carboxyl-terminal hydrolase n=1 Tax=Tegillarca granosa TaxID=220873 RepID=A0ABQ9DYD1_TEGGR|nr:hypothetical protein KUTeg_024436 [Tegillarca granosa]
MNSIVMAEKQHWVPLESNPEVLNKVGTVVVLYMYNLGVPSSQWEFVDVYGLEEELLGMVPRPVVAVMLLYPITEKSEASAIGDIQKDCGLYYCKQTIGNACGTVAIVHALANNRDRITFEDNKHFNKFIEDTCGMSAEERAAYLENDKAMGLAHEDSAQEGQTQAPSRDEKDTIEVVKKFMARDPDELNFTLMALSRHFGKIFYFLKEIGKLTFRKILNIVIYVILIYMYSWHHRFYRNFCKFDIQIKSIFFIQKKNLNFGNLQIFDIMKLICMYLMNVRIFNYPKFEIF